MQLQCIVATVAIPSTSGDTGTHEPACCSNPSGTWHDGMLPPWCYMVGSIQAWQKLEMWHGGKVCHTITILPVLASETGLAILDKDPPAPPHPTQVRNCLFYSSSNLVALTLYQICLLLTKTIDTLSDIIKLCSFSDSSSCFSTRWHCDSR